MLKILLKDGNEIECSGRVKFYLGEQPAFCHFELVIENNQNPDKSNLKLVYDTETQESVYFNFCSYGFYHEDYEGLYNKSKRDLQLIEKFRELVEYPIESGILTANINDLCEWLIFSEEDISGIFKSA